LISNNTKSNVFVRSDNLTKLKTILKEKSLAPVSVDEGIEVSGVKTDVIGKLAHGADLTILELTTRNASLEDVFLELTEGSEEFKGHNQMDKKS